MPVLVTVRNTGSNFALGILEEHYTRHYMTEDLHGDALWFGHVDSEHLPITRQRIEQYGPLIMTMRHPMAVASYWMKRGKELDNWFTQMWINLMNLKEEYEDSYWLPVDTQDREDYLRVLGERLDKDLQTDWTPKGVFYGASELKGGMRIPEAREFFLGHKSFFDQFGYVL